MFSRLKSKFSGVCICTRKFILKNGNVLQEKSLKMGYLSLPKWHLKLSKWGKGYEAQAGHPYPNQMWVPHLGIYKQIEE